MSGCQISRRNRSWLLNTLMAPNKVVSLCQQDSCLYVQQLVKPVLTCFFDSDSRVRYYGCESLYNIIKVARGSVLPFFNDIFDGLSRVGGASICIQA